MADCRFQQIDLLGRPWGKDANVDETPSVPSERRLESGSFRRHGSRPRSRHYVFHVMEPSAVQSVDAFKAFQVPGVKRLSSSFISDSCGDF